jgi:glucose-6-phosphate 1-dehydrogenase
MLSVPLGTFLVIFGLTGDLSRRYLLPALYHLLEANLLPKKLFILGVSRRSVSVEEVINGLRNQPGYKTELVDELADRITMVQMDLLKAEDYEELAALMDTKEAAEGVPFQRLFYLSMPPQVHGPVIDLLGKAGLNQGESRIIIEKPFGFDLASGKELVDRVSRTFKEEQIYRIDHYLAKETAQNILTFRFSNPFFEETWNHRSVKKIVIQANEQIGIEGRVAFYEQTGALRDFIQSHLLQILALVTMEEPAQLDAHHIRAEKLKLLQAIQPIAPNEVASQAVRAQYEGYTDEVGNPTSQVETFASLKLEIANDRWKGVPVILQTGKSLDQKSTTAVLHYAPRKEAHAEGNMLSIYLQPNEGVGMCIWVKKPGLGNSLELTEMDFRYHRSFNEKTPDAYERVLLDAIRGDQTLFASSEEVLRSWEIVDAVMQEWSHNRNNLLAYKPGSNPEQFNPLLK